MATPSYVTLVSGVQTILKNDNRLDGFKDSLIYFGTPDMIPKFPAMTIELQESDEQWVSFPNNKDLNSKISITIMARSYSYLTGLASVEEHAQTVDDVMRQNLTISGICYNSEISTKRFGTGFINETPVFMCQMDLVCAQRFNNNS